MSASGFGADLIDAVQCSVCAMMHRPHHYRQGVLLYSPNRDKALVLVWEFDKDRVWARKYVPNPAKTYWNLIQLKFVSWDKIVRLLDQKGWEVIWGDVQELYAEAHALYPSLKSTMKPKEG